MRKSHKEIKTKYRAIRGEFKQDLYKAAKDNRAFAMMIVETYVASQHRKHIGDIWELLGLYHQDAYKAYNDKISGKHLTGENNIMRSLFFTDKELHNKYFGKIPECFAMGDALAVAYRILQ
ncbi:hypothetical protein [Bacillus toyonensis]|uniref:hypothetical protein n=1 Tax=Bacillus toyonensis TaxID=155322 RepID=UPI002E1AA0B0|nr:hypothetical protein [Bacillus toyonensis]